MLQIGKASPEHGCCETLERTEPQIRHAEVQLKENKQP